MIETSSVPPWKSSEIFGKSPENVRKRSPYLRNNFGKSSEIFGKWSEIFGNSSKTSSKTSKTSRVHVKISCSRLVFSSKTPRVHIRYLTRSLRSLVRYRCEHSKINSISPRAHVLFSISSRHRVISSIYLI